MMHRLMLLVIVASATGTAQSPPIWEISTSCQIPNESQPGACQDPETCAAYQRINDVSSLGSVGRLSFLRQLQCSGMAEGQVCCPAGGNSYRNPSLNESLPRRTHVKQHVIGARVGSDGDEPCGQPNEEMKLYGGQITGIDEFPWMAMLIYDQVGDASNPVSPGCGGALISKSFVVTAAHCLVGKILQQKGNLKFVRLGEYNLISDPDCLVDDAYEDCTDGKVDINSKRIIVHPQYSPSAHSQHHDVGLIELERAVSYTTFIQHICLPEPTNNNGVAPGNKFNVCGWGRTDFFQNRLGKNVLSPVKLKVSLPYVDHKDCREVYRQQKLDLGKGQLCAGGHQAKDSCAGDSGSPLMFFDRAKGTWVLTGLVSFGVQKCGTEGKPGIYTNVREYVGWIKMNARL